MRFKDITGNVDSVQALRNIADSGKIPHALLISGPAGIGKMMMARAFIAFLNCTSRTPDGDSCGECPNCKQIAAGNHPDIHYIYPIVKSKANGKIVSSDYTEEWRRFLNESPYMNYPFWLNLMNAGNSIPQIGKEEANGINAEAALSTYSAPHKIFLIWLPERMHPSASNTLLKTIEEPHPDTLFICVSNEPGAILPTIYSRLQRIEMSRPSISEIESALTAKGISPANASIYARLSEGSLLKAFQYVSTEGEAGEFGDFFRNAMRDAFQRKVSKLKIMSDKFAELGREKTLRLLDYFARMTRENFIANLCLPPLNVMTPDEEAFSSKFAPFINAGNVEEIMANINDAKRDISRNGNSKLVWFDFLLKLMILIRKKAPQN